GVNCGGGPSALFNAVKEITLHTNLPVFAQPNAGMPRYENGKTVYDLSPDEFAASMAELADSGLFALGGCCGTTPEYIKKLIKATEKFEVKKFRYDKPAVCSSSAVVELKAGTVVGERVNPTGKPRLKQALISGDDDFVLNLCLEQTAAGAGILDINVGAAGIDEKAALVAVVKKVQGLTPAPLQIDTSRAEALCAAVRMVAGVPIINSVTAEEKSLNAVLPVAKKYGCYVICLPLDENGIPQTAEGRLELAEKIVEAAENCGVSRGKLIFDGLTMAQSVSGDNAKITLDTVAEFSKRGFMTCLGLSNISFGLPARELINATFYALALKRGLTLAIVNPAVKPEINLDALAVLGNEDENAANFIAKHAGETKPREALAEESSISGAIIKGLKREGAAIAKARANAENALSIIENEIIPALKTLGELYDQKRVFLPQLIAGSEAAKAVLDIVKPLMPASDRKLGVPMLILTVKGDVHDIGKNIVKAVLENYGFEIKDLGKSVDYPIVLEELARTDAKVVGLSALMTTTLDNMSETILKIRESYPDVVIIVGGAVVSEAYAKERGVLYAKDAGEAARVLSKIFADN
ncbi:MAG TPA: dihydropteroate synthase, partial [Eubacteriales bacterium]|nr:dihydropteroate synthase [Eubacteriales bacterium]